MNTTFATGLDVLLENEADLLQGKRIGLISHPAAVTGHLVDNVQALLEIKVNLTALFGPEHGFTGAVNDGIHLGDSHDPRTGLQLYSLYGTVLEPTEEMLQQIDVLVYDMQDVGVRFYTYLSTLYYLVRASGYHHYPLVVLDRPNPITGTRIEGPILEIGYQSFVGMLPIPIIHGMTLGELAIFINNEYNFNADLTVVPMRGWHREWWFDQTDRVWVPTSPGIPRFETTLVYPGTCLLEGTNLSEGRGTALPFEILGAPWVDEYLLVDRLNERKIPGVFFRPASFTPTTSKHQGKICQGVQIHVLDRESFSPLRTGLEVITACQSLFPDHFGYLPPHQDQNTHNHFDLLAGTDTLRLDLESGCPVEEITANWQSGLEKFSERRKPYLRYD
jgi:uncharacterized protein YbbC (DUF1343 family)